MNSRVINIILPIISVIVYIGIEVLYLYLNKTRYSFVYETILQRKINIDIVATCFAYAILGLGWYFIAVQLALSYYDKLKQRSPTWTSLASSGLSGLVAGFVYGFVVYGVMNLVLRALFAGLYPLTILVQDMAWGSLYNLIFTAVYMLLWRKLTSPVDL